MTPPSNDKVVSNQPVADQPVVWCISAEQPTSRSIRPSWDHTAWLSECAGESAISGLPALFLLFLIFRLRTQSQIIAIFNFQQLMSPALAIGSLIPTIRSRYKYFLDSFIANTTSAFSMSTLDAWLLFCSPLKICTRSFPSQLYHCDPLLLLLLLSTQHSLIRIKIQNWTIMKPLMFSFPIDTVTCVVHKWWMTTNTRVPLLFSSGQGL